MAVLERGHSSFSSNDDLWAAKVSVSKHPRLLPGPAPLQPAPLGMIIVTCVLQALINWLVQVRGAVSLAGGLARRFPRGKWTEKPPCVSLPPL